MEAEIDPWLISVQDTIREDFGWDITGDKNSLELLLTRFENIEIKAWKNPNREKALRVLSSLVTASKQKGFAVVGATATSEEIMIAISEGRKLIFADGSIGVLNELPDEINEDAWDSILFISSDCDGIPEIMNQKVSQTTVLLHAHADNISSWNQILDYWINNQTTPHIVVTHQLSNIVPYTINPGGFTDGDRAICSLICMGADKSEISLIGFSSNFVGRWSGVTDNKIKLSKLKWMNKILKHLGFMEV